MNDSKLSKETAIRAIVKNSVTIYASTFADRHIFEANNESGTINMKIHNIFIAALGKEIQYYSALSRSLDSSLGNMLEKMAISIAELNYTVSQHVEGKLYQGQTDYIAELLEDYKRHAKQPKISDYKGLMSQKKGSSMNRRHESDYYLIDKDNGMHYLIELKIGGDLDNKKARSEKEAILEQYCILTNELQSEDKVKIFFATAYNRFGEGKEWNQSRVRQYFAKDELRIGKDFWDFICKSPRGYDIVTDEYMKNAFQLPKITKKMKSLLYIC